LDLDSDRKPFPRGTYTLTTIKRGLEIAMKHMFVTLLGVVLLFGVCRADERPKLKERTEKESYTLGYQFGESLKKREMDIDIEVYAAGIRDSLEGKGPLMSEEEMRAAMAGIQQRAYAVQHKSYMEQAAKNLEDSKVFLAENAKKAGVKTLPSGLQYRVLEEGTGGSPAVTQTVAVYYQGTLIDGTEFDNSYRRGRPETFQVDSVIPGWTEALQMMKEGSKWELFIPPDLAYGERGMPPRIPPNSTLIFEVELISLN
jgi:FKBP-type peptidyl-prolyl cis-trans isomerase FklB